MDIKSIYGILRTQNILRSKLVKSIEGNEIGCFNDLRRSSFISMNALTS